ncbi:MAG: inorganic phosphate transporter [Parachlamydiaceae bacterium]|nr:inorganic phosphate transporter [Parachlamydiaceae bacterium]
MTFLTFFLFLTIIGALLFDIMNGFHDAANSIATIVSTRVLSPLVAVLWAAFFNFIAMFIFFPHVADTVSKIVKIAPNDSVYLLIIFSGLIGALLWDLLTWWLKLPTSSSHALIGGLSGAALIHAGWDSLRIDLLLKTVYFIVLSPLIGFGLGFLFVCLLYLLVYKGHPQTINRRFKKGQLLSAALYSIGHGANDAQKTMGVIMATLIAKGWLAPDAELSLLNPDTNWIILSCHLAMSIGTAFGGWRIVKTMGMRLTKLKPIDGFCAESAGAVTLFFATQYGIPVSTTQTITGAIIGVGSATTSFAQVKWNIASRILWAWILTIPGAALIASLCYFTLRPLFTD